MALKPEKMVNAGSVYCNQRASIRSNFHSSATIPRLFSVTFSLSTKELLFRKLSYKQVEGSTDKILTKK